MIKSAYIKQSQLIFLDLLWRQLRAMMSATVFPTRAELSEHVDTDALEVLESGPVRRPLPKVQVTLGVRIRLLMHLLDVDVELFIDGGIDEKHRDEKVEMDHEMALCHFDSIERLEQSHQSKYLCKSYYKLQKINRLEVH